MRKDENGHVIQRRNRWAQIRERVRVWDKIDKEESQPFGWLLSFIWCCGIVEKVTELHSSVEKRMEI